MRGYKTQRKRNRTSEVFEVGFWLIKNDIQQKKGLTHGQPLATSLLIERLQTQCLGL